MDRGVYAMLILRAERLARTTDEAWNARWVRVACYLRKRMAK